MALITKRVASDLSHTEMYTARCLKRQTLIDIPFFAFFYSMKSLPAKAQKTLTFVRAMSRIKVKFGEVFMLF